MTQQTFHQSMARVIFISQIFALLPVTNIFAKDDRKLRYKWLSVRVAYTFFIITLNVLEFMTVMHLIFREGFNFHTSGTISLYVVCLLEQMYFWRLAIHWPLIMRTWRQTETHFLRPAYQLHETLHMRRYIYLVTFFVMSCALVEHVLLVYNSFHNSEMERVQCHWNISHLESLFRRERYHLYIVLPFHIWLLPICEFINLTLAYVRSFTDTFIMCISIGLAIRFYQLRLRIASTHKKAMPVGFWIEVRQHHLLLRRLLRRVNRHITPLILLAFGNNMYFICFQLFNSFQNIGVNSIVVLAFWYSLLFAIGRTVLTIYVAATITDYSNQILAYIREVPSNLWCLELQRFSEQLSLDVTALTGGGFFFMTRQLILAMASTVVTYELMVWDIINKGSIQQRTDYCKNYENFDSNHHENIPANQFNESFY